MDTTIHVTVKDTTCGSLVIVREDGAEPVEYPLSDNSLSDMAWSIGQAVTDYLEGLG